jgi:hypothetical protein
MLSGWRRAAVIAYATPLLMIGPAALAQAGPTWIDPPAATAQLEHHSAPRHVTPLRETDRRTEGSQVEAVAAPLSDDEASMEAFLEPPAHGSEVEPTALSGPVRQPIRLASMNNALAGKKHAARDLAFSYLERWSAPNRVTLASAPSFYGPRVLFHGRTRSLASLLAEKRRFAERWPDRTYRYRPETTQISCESDGASCTVWSIFDYSAENPRQGRRSRGIGAHEIVVSFSGATPVIASENSRVLGRGANRR